jgi:uncharacterized integral membrane protein (TIGR00697 family)
LKRSQIVFFILGGFFITNALLAELIGGKLFLTPMPEFLQQILLKLGVEMTSFTMSVGILPWPFVFVATDLVNEFYGRKGVRFFTFVTMGLILYMLPILYFANWLPASPISPVKSSEFHQVFVTSMGIILASVVAFAVSQLVDVFVFTRVRLLTGGRFLWARATGSTLISQFIDTFLISFLAFVLPGYLTLEDYMKLGLVSYLYKVGVAILITPLCYAGHALVTQFVGRDEAEHLVKAAHSHDAS